MSTTASIATVLVVLFAVANGYSKYGRTCKDIGCLSHEVCVMQEDPCDKYQREACGPYPTCKKINNGGETCKTKSCDKGTYCKTENGRPVCVPTTPGLEYDSSGISSSNGKPVVPQDPNSRYASNNPYANAPPAHDVFNGGSVSGGYPPYPTNNNGGSAPPSGYPLYPNNNNGGPPPYPTNNNGYNKPAVDRYGYPVYPPASHRPEVNYRPGGVDQYGYPVTTRPNYDNRYNHNYPQMNQHGSNNYYGRRNGAASLAASSIVVLAALALCTRILTA